jgi:hypothetical protein
MSHGYLFRISQVHDVSDIIDTIQCYDHEWQELLKWCEKYYPKKVFKKIKSYYDFFKVKFVELEDKTNSIEHLLHEIDSAMSNNDTQFDAIKNEYEKFLHKEG